jgi:hypothetical protein
MQGGGLFVVRQECRDDVEWTTVGHAVALQAWGVSDEHEAVDEDASPVYYVGLQLLAGEIPK